MRETISATEARVHFGSLLRRVVEEQTPVVVERKGEPQVVVVPIPLFDRLAGLAPDTEPDDWWTRAQTTRDQVALDLHGRKLPPADEIIREMREERDAELGLR